jgi:hypothetical protein
MRDTARNVVALGHLPADAELDAPTARRYEEALKAVEHRPSRDEALALVALLPPDASTSFGLAWTLVHIIESSPAWPLADALDDRNHWVSLLRERAARST